MSDVVLQTPRLMLRLLTEDDLPSTRLLLQDPAVMYAYEGPFTDEMAESWLQNQLRRYREEGVGLWAVVRLSDGAVMGQCGLTLQPYADGRVHEVGYLLRPDFWHCGYATEAAAACCQYAARRLQLAQVYAIIRDSNLSSQRVAERLGMRQVDEMVKHYRGVTMPHLVYCKNLLNR